MALWPWSCHLGSPHPLGVEVIGFYHRGRACAQAASASYASCRSGSTARGGRARAQAESAPCESCRAGSIWECVDEKGLAPGPQALPMPAAALEKKGPQAHSLRSWHSETNAAAMPATAE
jgi:hypothetical protein